jgi:hypothetical protein
MMQSLGGVSPLEDTSRVGLARCQICIHFDIAIIPLVREPIRPMTVVLSVRIEYYPKCFP